MHATGHSLLDSPRDAPTLARFPCTTHMSKPHKPTTKRRRRKAYLKRKAARTPKPAKK